jgi:tellurite resistance protein
MKSDVPPPDLSVRPARRPSKPPPFPMARPAAFATTPPAIFPVVLGLLGLGLALKRVMQEGGLPPALADTVMGLVAGLWVFCAVAYGIKIARRPGVVPEDLRILPGRAGLASGSVGMMAVAAILGFFDVGAASVILTVALGVHVVLAGLVIRALVSGPPEMRDVTPVWHLSFTGFIVGALAAVPLGWLTLATGLLVATIAVATVIWGVSLWQLWRRVPPAPLRPLLAIHLAPASLFASVAGLLGYQVLATAMVLLGLGILVALATAGRWILASGFSPLWGAFTFPLATYASALVINGWVMPGVLLTVIALGVNPWIAWRVLKMWPAGSLAAKTNAAKA